MKELNQVIFRKFVCEEIFKIRQDYLGAQNTCYLSYLRQQKCHLQPISLAEVFPHKPDTKLHVFQHQNKTLKNNVKCVRNNPCAICANLFLT